MGKDCQHDHGDHHHQDHHSLLNTKNMSKAFLIGASINFLFVVIEFIYSFITQSVSLKADALHNLTDVLALLLSWFGYRLINSKTTADYTFGLKKASLLVAFINSSVIFISLFYILFEAVMRFISPQDIQETKVMVVAAIGLFVNLGSAFLFKHHHHDINVKSAYMHLIVDAMISFAVVISGLLIRLTGYHVIDPILAVLVVVVMTQSSWSLFKEAIQLLVAKVPRDINLKKIEQFLLSHNEVVTFHQLRIWSVSSVENAMTVHLVVKAESDTQKLMVQLSQEIKHDYKIQFVTLQIEVENFSKNLDCLS